jgi:hypothetical protein
LWWVTCRHRTRVYILYGPTLTCLLSFPITKLHSEEITLHYSVFNMRCLLQTLTYRRVSWEAGIMESSLSLGILKRGELKSLPTQEDTEYHLTRMSFKLLQYPRQQCALKVLLIILSCHLMPASEPIEMKWRCQRASQQRISSSRNSILTLTAVIPSLLWMWIFALHSNNFWIHFVCLQVLEMNIEAWLSSYSQRTVCELLAAVFIQIRGQWMVWHTHF